MKRFALCMSLAISLFTSLCPKSYSQKVPEIKTFDAQGAGTASGQGTVARSINITREIVGEYYDSKVAVHGFLRISSGASQPATLMYRSGYECAARRSPQN